MLLWICDAPALNVADTRLFNPFSKPTDANMHTHTCEQEEEGALDLPPELRADEHLIVEKGVIKSRLAGGFVPFFLKRLALCLRLSIDTNPVNKHIPTHPTEKAAIPPLPAHLLPPPECKGKGGSSDKKKKKKQKKTKREQQQDEEAEGEAAAADAAQGGGAGSGGLEKTVEELLRDYVPASVEGKRPFYCRVCRFQGGRCVFGFWLGLYECEGGGGGGVSVVGWTSTIEMSTLSLPGPRRPADLNKPNTQNRQ